MGENPAEMGIQVTKEEENVSKKLSRATESASGTRSFKDYLDELGIEINDLKGRVLDIGSGSKEQFAQGAAEHGIEIVSLNPKLASQKERKKRKNDIEDGKSDKVIKTPIAAISQHLPFTNETFGTVVSLYAVPTWLEPEDYKVSFGEIHRVLKPDGKAYLGPFDEHNIDAIKRALDENKQNYEIVDTPESEEILKKYGRIGKWDHKFNIVITKR